uniref:Protein-tyrosine-phosphatase n=1 Tax=Panagrellus redivivus TaxID=6233 RepID=A0A7E4V346_PANRE
MSLRRRGGGTLRKRRNAGKGGPSKTNSDEALHPPTLDDPVTMLAMTPVLNSLRHMVKTSNSADNSVENKDKDREQTPQTPRPPVTPGGKPPIEVPLQNFARASLQKKTDGIKAEFIKITNLQPTDPTCTALTLHPYRNRYHNNTCYDRTRVVLKYLVPSEVDYINANWVTEGPNFKLANKFICTQGPIENTVNDFWRMVWQEKPKHIIMLCKTLENGKSKCAQYWPLGIGETKTFGTVCVTHVRSITAEKEKIYDSSVFCVQVGSETHNLEHHRWNSWPDFGVPQSGIPIIRLLRHCHEPKDAPIVVHCAAGIGRTGTFMAVEIAMKMVALRQEINIYEVVKELRNQRGGMVQTPEQYLFVHRCIFEYMNAKHIARNLVTEFNTAYLECVNQAIAEREKQHQALKEAKKQNSVS